LRDPVTYSGVSSSKYNLFRAEQIAQDEDHDRLALPVDRPVLPEYGTSPTLSPKIKAMLEQQRHEAGVQ